MAQSLRRREHPNWVLSMNERYSVIIASSLGFLVHRLDAEKLEATTRAAFDHLDAQRFRPSVRRAEDSEHGIESRRESRGGGRVRLAFIGHDNDAHSVGDFAGLVVGHLHCLGDCVRHVQRLVEVFVEFFGVLQCAVELDFAFAGRSVDEVLDGAEFGVLGVERDECGIVVFHCLTFPRLLLFFSGLYLKSFISHVFIIFNVGVSVCMLSRIPFLRFLKSRILVKSLLIHRDFLRKNTD
nr:MAG TPA: hypothetical protein [Caudoviricetes sp.]